MRQNDSEPPPTDQTFQTALLWTAFPPILISLIALCLRVRLSQDQSQAGSAAPKPLRFFLAFDRLFSSSSFLFSRGSEKLQTASSKSLLEENQRVKREREREIERLLWPGLLANRGSGIGQQKDWQGKRRGEIPRALDETARNEMKLVVGIVRNTDMDPSTFTWESWLSIWLLEKDPVLLSRINVTTTRRSTLSLSLSLLFRLFVSLSLSLSLPLALSVSLPANPPSHHSAPLSLPLLLLCLCLLVASQRMPRYTFHPWLLTCDLKRRVTEKQENDEKEDDGKHFLYDEKNLPWWNETKFFFFPFSSSPSPLFFYDGSAARWNVSREQVERILPD